MSIVLNSSFLLNKASCGLAPASFLWDIQNHPSCHLQRAILSQEMFPITFLFPIFPNPLRLGVQITQAAGMALALGPSPNRSLPLVPGPPSHLMTRGWAPALILPGASCYPFSFPHTPLSQDGSLGPKLSFQLPTFHMLKPLQLLSA